MSGKTLNALRILLITLITSTTITGISIIDDQIWNIIIAVIGVVAYGIVGVLYSLKLISSSQDGKTAFAVVFIILIIVGFFLYQGILRFEQWIVSWDLWIKITIPTILGICIIVVATILIVNKIKREKKKNSIKKEDIAI